MPVSLDRRPSNLPSREDSFHSAHSTLEAGPLRKPSYIEATAVDGSHTPRSIYSDDDDNDYDADNMLDDYYDEYMGPEPEQLKQADAAPALPDRSALRTSRVLNAFAVKIGQAHQTTISRPAPQEIYLSSEEDASSSADEFSDYDWESGSESSGDSPKKVSHEDTAKAVSVVFVGKPSIINLRGTSKRAAARRSVPPAPKQKPEAPIPQVTRSATEPLALPRTSSSSDATEASISSSISARPGLPQRSSSRTQNVLTKQRPAFLSIDPYAGKSYHESVEGRHGYSGSPITPKQTNMLRKGLSIVRKRSRPALREAANRDSIASSTFSFQQIQDEGVSTPARCETPPPAYSPPRAPPTPPRSSRLLGSFSKRKSIKY